MSTKTEDMHTYTLSFSGPFALTEDEQTELRRAFFKHVTELIPYFGAGSMKYDVKTKTEMDADDEAHAFMRKMKALIKADDESD